VAARAAASKPVPPAARARVDAPAGRRGPASGALPADDPMFGITRTDAAPFHPTPPPRSRAGRHACLIEPRSRRAAGHVFYDNIRYAIRAALFEQFMPKVFDCSFLHVYYLTQTE